MGARTKWVSIEKFSFEKASIEGSNGGLTRNICLKTTFIVLSCVAALFEAQTVLSATVKDSQLVSNNNLKPAQIEQKQPQQANLNVAADQSNSRPSYQKSPSVYHSIIDSTNLNHNPISAAVQASSSTEGDLSAAAGHHHGHHAHGKYYEYRAVPKKKTWKFGYKRGNHKHTISRHEHGQAGKHPHFKTKVKWHDSKSKGKGIHLWDYNHHDKKHYHHHG